MYEFTWGGMWIRWSALDRTGKWLMILTTLFVIAAAVPPSQAMGAWLAGCLSAIGLPVPVRPVAPFTPLMAVWTIGCGALAAVLWWLFSRRQDEMFNQVQNWSVGNAAIWTLHFCLVWNVLALAKLTPPVSGAGLLAFAYLAFVVLWLKAVRRWA